VNGKNVAIEADRVLAAHLYPSREALRNLERLCAMGSRFGGTPSEIEARDYIEEQFKQYGLNEVRAEEFGYTGWVRGVSTLHVMAQEETQVPCIALPYTGSCQVEGEFIYIGYGTPGEFASLGDQIAGKIVMVAAKSPGYSDRPIHRGEKIGRAVALGAVGFIWMRWEAGFLPETGTAAFNQEAPIPCVGISREHGEELKRLARRGPVRLRLVTENAIKPMESWNVMGELPGARRPDEIIVVGAHFDGHDIAPGAMDDGSGAAVVMEAARGLAAVAEHLERTVRFITFPVEELGLIGSYAYVEQHRAEMDKHLFMLNLDAAGRHSEPYDLALQGRRPELIRPLRAMGEEMGVPLWVDESLSPYSDHFPFMLAGVPAATCMQMKAAPSGVRGWGHTAADTLDKVSGRSLQEAALHTARILFRLSNLEPWPARRQTEAEVRAVLDEYQYGEVLRLENRYPF